MASDDDGTPSQGEPPRDDLLLTLADDLLTTRRAVPLHQVLAASRRGPGLPRPTLELLCRELRSQGYLLRAREVAGWILERWPSGSAARRLAHLEGEMLVLEGTGRTGLDAARTAIELPNAVANPGTVLMVTGRSLPDVTTNYATHVYAVASGLESNGWHAEIVTEPGFRAFEAEITEDVDGVPHHRLAGPERGAVPLDEWLEEFAQALSVTVQRVRPAVIVAHSDFLNVLPSLEAGRRSGVPVIYDVSGDWDQSWYRRQAEMLGWPAAGELALGNQGLPDRYVLRRERERAAWKEVDLVVLTSASSALRAAIADVRPDVALVGPSERLARYAGVLEAVSSARDDAGRPTSSGESSGDLFAVPTGRRDRAVPA